jgi:hypothetical protein
MLLLTNTTHILEVATTTTAAIDVSASYVDITSTTFTPGSQDTAITTATTTTVIAAPGASTQRQVKQLTIKNKGAVSNTITVKKDISGTEYVVFAASLSAGDMVQYTDGNGFVVLDVAGRTKTTDSTNSGNTGITSAFYKVGTAPEAAGQWYCWAKDSGNPGAWAPGTPGLNGRATDGTLAADNGSLRLPTASGSLYLTYASVVGSVVHSSWLADVLWVNSGLVVTTTTAQAIAAPVALPARDLNGASNGHGVWAGILVTTATTNAGVITNTTMSYTNSAGVAGRTATIASFPATAVIGTVVWFQLAAGDTGVQSIQSVTLGTSYGGGAISIILAVPLYNQAILVANVGGVNNQPQTPGIRLYTGSCILPFGLMTATTATTIVGSIQVMDR